MDIFDKRKGDILSKLDKSSKGGWDKKIVSLCEKVNKKKNYYTTSSCSGRIMLFFDREKKGPGVFVWVSHDKIDLKSFLKVLGEVSERIGNKKANFKQECCGLHVACRGLKQAQEFLDKAKLAGWKRSGIISSNKRFVCELMSTEKLEFPIFRGGKLLVGEGFLREVVEKSNENLEKSWKKIRKLESLL